MALLWIVIGIIVGFFMASGVVGWLTFPFEAYKTQQAAFIDRICEYDNGTDKGQCAIEPSPQIPLYIINGLGQIVNFGNFNATSYFFGD